MSHRFERKALAVPSSRLSRLTRFGGLVSSIAGNVAADAARRFARGERPSMEDLLLTPANARKLADEMARMRGAAMKVGQLISMDAGDMLPPELAEHPRPPALRGASHALGAAEAGAERRLGRGLAAKVRRIRRPSHRRRFDRPGPSRANP